MKTFFAITDRGISWYGKNLYEGPNWNPPIVNIDPNMTPFIILKKNFFVPFKKVEFLFAFMAKQSFIEQNRAHFWHISSKISCLAGIGLNLSMTHKIRKPDDPEKNPDFMGYVQFQLVKMVCWKCAKNELCFALRSFFSHKCK